MGGMLEWSGIFSTFNMEPIHLTNARFPLGALVITRNAYENLDRDDFTVALQRHVLCDWGDVCEEDRIANTTAYILDNGRLFSVYTSSKKVKFWVITESGYSYTTVLLPEDY